MAKEIFMPKLSSTMEVGTLLQWFKEEGDSVQMGDPLFEIMTDKINIEVEAYDDGILLKKYFEVDEEIPVNQIIGYIGEQNETVPNESPGISSDEPSAEASVTTSQAEAPQQEDTPSVEVPVSGKVRATPAARRVARDQKIQLFTIAGTGPNGRIHKKDVLQYVADSKTNATRITPLAQKIAQAENIDLSQLTGSGANGKIVKQDVIQSLTVNITSPAPTTKKTKKISGLRKVVADRMKQSKATAPHVTLTSDVDMTKAKEIRAQLLPLIEKQTGYRLSFTEILVKAVGATLVRHPSVNASVINDEIVYNDDIHIGLAVAVEDGLMVPVLKNVNTKGLSTLTAEAKDIGKRAREKKLQQDEMKGSTFTISNLGMYAIDAFTPIINLPETAILGVGRIQDKPIVIDKSIEIRPMMTLSLSFDHRAIDGAPAAAFLTELKRILENPFELLV